MRVQARLMLKDGMTVEHVLLLYSSEWYPSLNATTSSFLLLSRASNSSTVLDLFSRATVFVMGNHADLQSAWLLGDRYL